MLRDVRGVRGAHRSTAASWKHPAISRRELTRHLIRTRASSAAESSRPVQGAVSFDAKSWSLLRSVVKGVLGVAAVALLVGGASLIGQPAAPMNWGTLQPLLSRTLGLDLQRWALTTHQALALCLALFQFLLTAAGPMLSLADRNRPAAEPVAASQTAPTSTPPPPPPPLRLQSNSLPNSGRQQGPSAGGFATLAASATVHNQCMPGGSSLGQLVASRSSSPASGAPGARSILPNPTHSLPPTASITALPLQAGPAAQHPLPPAPSPTGGHTKQQRHPPGAGAGAAVAGGGARVDMSLPSLPALVMARSAASLPATKPAPQAASQRSARLRPPTPSSPPPTSSPAHISRSLNSVAPLSSPPTRPYTPTHIPPPMITGPPHPDTTSAPAPAPAAAHTSPPAPAPAAAPAPHPSSQAPSLPFLMQPARTFRDGSVLYTREQLMHAKKVQLTHPTSSTQHSQQQQQQQHQQQQQPRHPNTAHAAAPAQEPKSALQRTGELGSSQVRRDPGLAAVQSANAAASGPWQDRASQVVQGGEGVGARAGAEAEAVGPLVRPCPSGLLPGSSRGRAQAAEAVPSSRAPATTQPGVAAVVQKEVDKDPAGRPGSGYGGDSSHGGPGGASGRGARPGGKEPAVVMLALLEAAVESPAAEFWLHTMPATIGRMAGRRNSSSSSSSSSSRRHREDPLDQQQGSHGKQQAVGQQQRRGGVPFAPAIRWWTAGWQP